MSRLQWIGGEQKDTIVFESRRNSLESLKEARCPGLCPTALTTLVCTMCDNGLEKTWDELCSITKEFFFYVKTCGNKDDLFFLPWGVGRASDERILYMWISHGRRST